MDISTFLFTLLNLLLFRVAIGSTMGMIVLTAAILYVAYVVYPINDALTITTTTHRHTTARTPLAADQLLSASTSRTRKPSSPYRHLPVPATPKEIWTPKTGASQNQTPHELLEEIALRTAFRNRKLAKASGIPVAKETVSSKLEKAHDMARMELKEVEAMARASMKKQMMETELVELF